MIAKGKAIDSKLWVAFFDCGVEMSTKDYYFVCNMVWSVLSGFHYLFEGWIGDKVRLRLQTWSSLREDAAAWLSNEAENIAGKDNISKQDYRKLVKVSETEGDKVIFYAAERINKAADSLPTNDLSRDEIALYHYMRWLQTTLADGSQVINDRSTQLDTLFASETVLRLRNAVAAEIRKIENLDLPELVESANRVSKDIFTYWQARVVEMCDANSR